MYVAICGVEDRRISSVNDVLDEMRCVVNLSLGLFSYRRDVIGSATTSLYLLFRLQRYHLASIADEVEARTHLVHRDASEILELFEEEKVDILKGTLWRQDEHAGWFREERHRRGQVFFFFCYIGDR